MKSISRKYNVLLVVVSIVCIVLLFTGTSTIKVSKTAITNPESEISRAVVNEEKPKSVDKGGSDNGSQEAAIEESPEESIEESAPDIDSSEYRGDLEDMLKDGVLREEFDSESSNNLPSAVGVIGNEYEREWLNKSENWEKFMNEKNGPRAKLFKKYGDYKEYRKAKIEERIHGKLKIKVNVTRMPDIPLDYKAPYAAKHDCKPYYEPIDLVITWVNGTDPDFLELLKKNNPENADETEASRFRDMNQLKYSIRSFQKYAPWIRNIILLTNGQVPVWLNTDHPNVRVVTHEEIFADKSHLPTFSSPAIEINMHRIPGLSNRFIYANDDFFLMKPICPDIFITDKDEIILYPKEGKEHRTAYGARKKFKYTCDCPQKLLGNGQCNNNRACNKFECIWDGHDCDDILPLQAYYIDQRASYHQSVDYTQLILDRKFYGYGYGMENRTWNSHMPMMYDKRILQNIWEDFPLEAQLTSSHTRRKKTDLQFQMMTIYYTIESPRNRDYWKYPQFKHIVKPQDEIVGYYALKQDFKYVVLRLVMARQFQKTFNCINDNLDHDGGDNSLASYFFLEQFYEEYFPDQSPMEKFNYYPYDLYSDLNWP